MDKDLLISGIVFFGTSAFLFFVKPNFMFNSDGSSKSLSFKMDSSYTIFPWYLLSFSSAILYYTYNKNI